ncbi:Zinc finger, PMZ-type [Artemisia annua]|uniref:Protein FAR1-RELATED SEQUENCE n=1 Tax=Artemisia annua TaxID=35608 RepID=A0A2U1NH42_ARTAN|nr:Zinc finger, PMZ-type [Artemisia annua]
MIFLKKAKMNEGFHFDLNEVFMDEDLLMVQEADTIDEAGHNEKEYVEPFVCQCFLSEEDALLSIKRKPDVKLVDYSKKQRNRDSTRCECKAMMHDVRYLPSYRKLTIEDEKRILLLKKVDLAIEDVEQKQMHDTMLVKYRGSCLRSPSPLEEQGYRFFTPFAFKKFQEEFAKANQYSVKQVNDMTFNVNHHASTRSHKVFWDGKVAKCSCKAFEFVGILCRHILGVFIHKDCFEIPSTYWSPRWCRQEFQLDEISIGHQDKNIEDSTCLNNVAPPPIDLVERPPSSNPKGRPKKYREKNGKEVMTTKQVRCCRLCKRVGHSISRCPDKDNLGGHVIAQKLAMKRKTSTIESEDLNPIFV